ncbi:MAG: hypothetical protein K8L99_19220 [Anaerolineae bacterium]|nr:hypothetical protein [Anaerolineae bacterium]
MHNRIGLWALVIALALLAACAPSEQPASEASGRNAPTAPAPDWTESAAPITLENVTNIALLGRLDNSGEPSTVFAHSLSPDGTRLAGLNNEQLLIWDLINGELVTSTTRLTANHVYFSPDKTEVYTVNPEGSVTIYDAETGKTRTDFESVPNFNETMAYYAEDGWLAFGSLRGSVKVWDPLERTARVTIEAHALRITALAFSDNGDLLATAGEEGTVKIWNWQDRELLATLDEGEPVDKIVFSPDATQLAVSVGENTRLWSIPDATRQRVIDTGPGGTEILAYTPDGRYLINGGDTPEIAVWDPQTGNLAARLPGTGGDRVALAFSPDGTLMVTSVLNGTTTLWNLTTITSTTVNRADLTISDLVFSVDWTSDSRLITVFSASGGVYVWGVKAT